MAYKVAVASSDGKVINRHFGHAEQFLVFELGEEEFRFLESRDNLPPCLFQEHDEELFDRTVALLSDCRVVLASRIGPGAAAALEARGVKSYAVPNYIDEALQRLLVARKAETYIQEV